MPAKGAESPVGRSAFPRRPASQDGLVSVRLRSAQCLLVLVQTSACKVWSLTGHAAALFYAFAMHPLVAIALMFHTGLAGSSPS